MSRGVEVAEGGEEGRGGVVGTGFARERRCLLVHTWTRDEIEQPPPGGEWRWLKVFCGGSWRALTVAQKSLRESAALRPSSLCGGSPREPSAGCARRLLRCGEGRSRGWRAATFGDSLRRVPRPAPPDTRRLQPHRLPHWRRSEPHLRHTDDLLLLELTRSPVHRSRRAQPRPRHVVAWSPRSPPALASCDLVFCSLCQR